MNKGLLSLSNSRMARLPIAFNSRFLCLVLTLSIPTPSFLSAQTLTGTATTNAWETGANWSTGVVPNSAGAVITVTNNTTISLGSTRTVGTVNHYGSGNLVIGSTADANSILNLDNGANAGVFNITNANGLMYVYSDLTGNNGFTKTGAGTLAFRYNTRNLNYSGPISLSAGKLVIDRDGSLGNAANDVSMGAGSVLVYQPGVANTSTTLGSGRTITFTNTGEFGMEVVGTGTMTVQGDVVSGGSVVADFRKYGTGNLDLQGAVNYTGNTIISGGNLKLSSSTTLASGKNIDFRAAGAIDFSGSTQTVNGLILSTSAGSARTFILTNGNVSIGSGTQITFGGSNGTVFNASGLQSLDINMGSAKNFTVRPDTNSGAATNQWILAGQGAASNSITAANVTIGTAAASGGTANQGELHLGKINVINTTNFLIGGFNGSGLVKNQAGVTSSDLKVRSVDGIGALAKWTIGETSSGSRSGAGVVDLNGGSLDAVVTDLLVGRHIAAANNGSTSSLNMGGGSLLAAKMVLGEKMATGTPTLTSTMTQTGGESKIGTLIFGNDAGIGAAANFISTYNLSAAGASLAAQDINAGSGGYGSGSVRKINFGAGTIRNYDANTDLTISGRDTTASGRLEIAVASNASTKTFFADPGRKITIEETAVITSTGGIVKDGGGSLFLKGANTYSGGTTVSGGTLIVNNIAGSGTGTGALTVSSGGTLKGNGVISGFTQINGTHSPGNSPGLQTFSGGLTYTASSTLVWELSANTALNTDRGLLYDGIDLTSGELNIFSGATVDLVFNSLLAGGSASTVDWANAFWDVDQSWVLINNSGTLNGSSSTFVIDSVGADSLGNTLLSTRGSFSVSNSGNNVVLSYQAIPEPTSVSLVLLAAGVALANRRRKSV